MFLLVVIWHLDRAKYNAPPDDTGMALHHFYTRILDTDLTEPYRHVHHSGVLLFLEQARIAQLREIDWDFPQQLERGVLLVIAAIEITFLRELFAEEITIATAPAAFDDKRFSMTQTIRNARGKDAVHAVVTQAVLDLKTKRAIIPPESLIKGLS